MPQPIFVRRDDDPAPRVLAALGLAVVAHLLFTGAVALLSITGLLSSNDPPKTAPVDLVSVDSSRWNENRHIGSLPIPAPPVSPPKKAAPPVQHEELPKGQIVDVHGGNNEKPDDAAYLADSNNRVAHQTRAREQTSHYVQAMPQKTTTAPTKDGQGIGPKGEHGNGGKAQDDLAAREGSHAGHQELPSERATHEVAMAETAPDGQIHNTSEAKQQRGNSARLLLTPGQLAQTIDDPGSLGHAGREGDNVGGSGELAEQSGAAPNDKLDVDQGNGTFLNTREFRYAQFFNRVKQRVGEQWNSDAILKRRDPRGQFADRERATLLMVTLDTEGRVTDVRVRGSSGVTALDEEAVAAFQRAQPFPNPPAALFDADGLLTFGFGFYIEPNQAGSGLRVYRSRD